MTLTATVAPTLDDTGGGLLAAQLVAEGVDVVFGVPGAQLDWAVDGLVRRAPGIRFVHCRHEQGAAYLADGYARTSGRAGVLMVVPGPGMLNAAAGLATAWACSSPVVAIVGSIPTGSVGRRLGVLHEIDDQSAILRSLTKWHAIASTADEIPALVNEAFGQARSGRPRPVAIEVPADVLTAAGRATIREPAAVVRNAPARSHIEEAARLLAGAAAPVIVAGAGAVAADAQAALTRVAEALGSPVQTTPNGRSAIPSDHRLAVTPSVGRELLDRADVVLAVGTRFVNLRGEILAARTGRTLIQINADPADLGGERLASVCILADAALGLEALSDALATHDLGERAGPDLDRLRRHHDDLVAAVEPQASYVAAIRAALPRDGIVVSDLTQVGYLANGAFPVLMPRTYLTAGWQGTLGFAFPTAIGAKVARPDVEVVAIVGDGGFGFTLAELATAVAHEVPVVVVVFADGAFGNVRRTQAVSFGGRYLATELANPDFAALASAFGAAAQTATSPEELTRAIVQARGAHGPTLIQVPVGPMPSPWHVLDDRPVLSR